MFKNVGYYKNSLLNNCKMPINFRLKAIYIVNYIFNCLLIKKNKRFYFKKSMSKNKITLRVSFHF